MLMVVIVAFRVLLPNDEFNRFGAALFSRREALLRARRQATMLIRTGGAMSAHSRRDFLAKTSAGLAGAAWLGSDAPAQTPPQQPSAPPAGMPPAFGAGPAVGPEVSPTTFAEAEKLVQVQLEASERAVAAKSWRSNLAA